MEDMPNNQGVTPSGSGLRPDGPSQSSLSRAEPLVPNAHDARIARYLRAYAAANGHPLAETIAYDRGWYRFRSGWRETRTARAAKMDEMIVRLEWRVSEDGRQFFRDSDTHRQAETVKHGSVHG